MPRAGYCSFLRGWVVFFIVYHLKRYNVLQFFFFFLCVCITLSLHHTRHHVHGRLGSGSRRLPGRVFLQVSHDLIMNRPRGSPADVLLAGVAVCYLHDACWASRQSHAGHGDANTAQRLRATVWRV